MNQQRALLIALRDEETPDEEEVKKDIYKSRESDKLGCQKQRLLSSPLERGAGGCVAEKLHTPLSPLFRGESKRLKFLIVKLADGIDTDGLDNVLAQHSRNQRTPLFPPFARGDTGGCKKNLQKKKFLQSNTISADDEGDEDDK